MADIQVIYDDANQVTGVRRVETGGLLQQAKDAYTAASAAKALIEQNAKAFVGDTAARTVAFLEIKSSEVLTEEEKAKAIEVLLSHQYGDQISYRQQGIIGGLAADGAPPSVVKQLIVVFKDP